MESNKFAPIKVKTIKSPVANEVIATINNFPNERNAKEYLKR